MTMMIMKSALLSICLVSQFVRVCLNYNIQVTWPCLLFCLLLLRCACLYLRRMMLMLLQLCEVPRISGVEVIEEVDDGHRAQMPQGMSIEGSPNRLEVVQLEGSGDSEERKDDDLSLRMWRRWC